MSGRSVASSDRFSIVPDAAAGTCALLDRGAPTDIRLDGDGLEAQFAVEPTQHLVILSAGSPYEAGLYIYLLDQAARPIDALELSAPYTPGLFVGLESSDNTAVQFEFDGGARYVIRVLETPRWWLPLPSGARRHGSWKRRRNLDLRRSNEGTDPR